MTVYAVLYTYDDRTSRRDEVRPEHRRYLAGLAESGALLASGPWADGRPGALLIMSADSAEKVQGMVGSDPFVREGLVAEHEVREWTQVFGPWTD